MHLDQVSFLSALSHRVSTTTVAAALIGSIIVYSVSLVIYRLALHPLARFPGPKLAAATYWYEHHYDVRKNGRYIWRIIEMHEKYGPVVRINPNELHIRDSDFYHEIYHSKAYKTDRDRWYNLQYLGESLGFTIPHDVHAVRRAAIAPYFSMKSIRALEDRIRVVAEGMVDRLHQAHASGEVVDLRYLFAAFALDIVTGYAFGTEHSTNLMNHPDLGKYWADLTQSHLPMNNTFRHFPGLMKAMMSLPSWLVVRMNPDLQRNIEWEDSILRQVRQTLGSASESGNKREVTVIRELANSSLPAQDRTEERLKAEANMVVGAGGETTATVLARTVYHIIANPEVHQRLKKELDGAIPDPSIIPPLTELTQLPYLNAVIEEGLRISHPVMSRSPRVFQDHVLHFQGWTIQPGTTVSTAPYVVQIDPTIFPEPSKFKPERWLDNKGLQKYQVVFSKGRRNCLGTNLAYTELQLALAITFRRFELESYQNSPRDVAIVHDWFIGYPATDAKPLKVTVVKDYAA